MKKIFLSALFASLGVAASMNAAELPQATVTAGIIGKYTCSQGYMPNVELQYLVDGEALTIDFVNVKIKYESWDIDHEYPVYYTDLTLVNQEGEETAVTAGIYTPSDWDPLSATRASNHSGTTVTITLPDKKNYEWAKEEYKLIIPENTFVDMEGNINAAQEITWTNLTQYVTSVNSNIIPAPMSETVSGVYNPDQLKAVTLPFNGEVVYNAGYVTYANGTEVVPMENIKCNGNNLVIDLSYLANGLYSFEIPAGIVTVGGNALSQAVTFIYVVWNGLQQGEMITGPALKDDYAPNIELYFGTDIQPVGGQFAPIGVYKYVVSGDPVFEIPAENISLKEISYEGETIQVLYLDIEDIFADLTQVAYIIYIPENYVENSNHETNPAQQIKFTILPLAPQPAITMEGSIIELRWDASKAYNDNPHIVRPYVVLPNGTQRTIGYSYTSDNSTISDIKTGVRGLRVNLTQIIEEAGDGNYELVLPKASFQMEIDDVLHICPEIRYPFVIGNPPVEGLVEYTVTGMHTVYGENGVVLSENKDSFFLTVMPLPEEGLLDVYEFAGYDVPAPFGYQGSYFIDLGTGEYVLDTEAGGNLLTDFNEDGEVVLVASAGEEFTYFPWVTLTLPTDSEDGTLSDFTIWLYNDDDYEPVALLDAWSNLTVTQGRLTGVDTIKPTAGEEVIYNLNGVRVDRERMTDGIYIINGKKVVVRK